MTTTDLHAAAAKPNMRALKQLLLVLCVAQLMVILDITAVNVALPDMAKGLGITGGDMGWTITSYSLIFGSLLLLGGRAADLLGRRRMFFAGLAVFVARIHRRRHGGRRRDALRGARRAGPGRGDALPGRALDPDEHLQGRHAAGARARPPGAPSAAQAPPSAS